MNSLERVFAAVEGKPSDRRAVGVLLSLYGATLTGCPLEEYYTNASAYASGQSAVRERFQPDLLFAPFVLTAEGEAFGSKVAFFNNQAPNMVRPAVESAEEVARLSIPDINSHPRLLFIRESIRQLASQYGREVPIVGILLGPVDLPALIMGIDAWLDALLFREKSARLVLDMTTEFFVNWANTLLSDGATVLVLPNLCNAEVVTPKIVREIAVPVCQEAFKEVKGPLVIHSAGARAVPFLDYYASLPNVVGFVLDSRDSFSEAREKVGFSKVLFGNIDGPTLGKRDVEKVREDCEKVLADRSSDMHFVLSTCSADVAYDTPPQNIHAMLQAAESHAQGASR